MNLKTPALPTVAAVPPRRRRRYPPLNALIGMGQAELATATEEGAGMRMQRMQTLTDAARTLALILDDVSDLDAIGRGRLRLRPRVLPLPQELAAIAATHAERARRLGIPFSTSTSMSASLAFGSLSISVTVRSVSLLTSLCETL